MCSAAAPGGASGGDSRGRLSYIFLDNLPTNRQETEFCKTLFCFRFSVKKSLRGGFPWSQLRLQTENEERVLRANSHRFGKPGEATGQRIDEGFAFP